MTAATSVLETEHETKGQNMKRERHFLIYSVIMHQKDDPHYSLLAVLNCYIRRKRSQCIDIFEHPRGARPEKWSGVRNQIRGHKEVGRVREHTERGQ